MKKSTIGIIIISVTFLGLFAGMIWESGWNGVLAIIIALVLTALLITGAHLIDSDD